MAVTLNYNWQNIAGYQVKVGPATISFWIDAKLNRQDVANNYSVVDTRLTTTMYGTAAGSSYSFWLTGSNGISGSSVWTYGNETVLNGQFTVTHEADGTKSSVVSASASNGYLAFNISFSGDIILPRINKAPMLSTLTSTNVTYNSATLSFSVTDSGGAAVTNTSISVYEDSELNVLKETKTGDSLTFTNLKPNHSYYAVGSATNLVGTTRTDKLKVSTEGSIVRLRSNGQWKDSVPYIRVNGQWKEITPYIRSNGQWKEGI